MYAYFIGKVAQVGADSIVLETNGIGYNIIMSSRDLSEIIPGDELRIYTYTSVREDAIWLYGFLDRETLSFFKLLLTVNGVGPKGALGILSGASVDDIRVAIIAQDAKTLSKLPGIGAKTAARIILDLKDKVSAGDILGGLGEDVNTSSGHTSSAKTGVKAEATEVLTTLGYSASEAMRALNRLEYSEDISTEDLVTMALREL
jgi:Holliday junction DNA helicase RuvA